MTNVKFCFPSLSQSLSVMRAECRFFFKNLLSRLKICFVYSFLIANKFFEKLDRVLAGQ